MKHLTRLLAQTTIVLVLTPSQSLAQSVYEPYTFTTLAGNAGYGSADGTGSEARFGAFLDSLKPSGPNGVTLDSVGNLYVADTHNHTIRKGYAAPVTEVNLIVTTGPSFGFILTGPPGWSVVVEASIDLVNWLPLWTNTFAGALHFSEPAATSYPIRFYRSVAP